MKTMISKHLNLFYYLFAFGWTWSLAFLLIFTHAVDNVTTPTPVFVLTGILSGIAPSVSALLLTRIAKGKAGTAALLGQVHVRTPGFLVAASLLIVPGVLLLTTLAGHFTLRPYSFRLTIPLMAVGLIWPFFSCLGEEFGWRGLILPQLLRRHGTLKAGLILGVIWTFWHLPMYYIGYQNYGSWMLPAFLIIGLMNLTLQSVVMAWLYARSGGSLKLTIFYHYTITAAAILKDAFLTAESSPRFTVLEGLISVAFSLIVVFFLYTGRKSGASVPETRRGMEQVEETL